MASPKRFINGEMWDKDWFLDLPLKMKLAWVYMFTSCNHAGVWDIQLKRMCFSLQTKVSIDEIWEHLGSQLIPLKDNKVYLKKFLKHQYNAKAPGDLGNSPVHISVRKELSLYDDEIKGVVRVPKGLTKPLITIKDKDKDKVKVKVKYNTIDSIDDNLLSELKLQFPTKDVAFQLEKFRDYLSAKGKTYKNYKAGFRNWLNSDYCKDIVVQSKHDKLREEYGTR